MRVLLTGAGGQLGAYALDELVARGHDAIAWGHTRSGTRGGVEIQPVDLEVTDIERLLAEIRPEAVVHLAAVSTAEGVRLNRERAWLVNVEATRRIADWCGRSGSAMVFSSTDLVFDGSKSWWCEADETNPVLLYGQSKAEAESAVRAIPTGLVARVSLLFGFSRAGRDTYFDRTMAALRVGEPQTMFSDEFRTPLDLATAARALVRLAERKVTGVIHVAGRQRMSRFELVQRAAIALGLDPDLVRSNLQRDAQLAEPRPLDVSLDTTRWDEVLHDLPRPSIEEVMQSVINGDSKLQGT